MTGSFDRSPRRLGALAPALAVLTFAVAGAGLLWLRERTMSAHARAMGSAWVSGLHGQIARQEEVLTLLAASCAADPALRAAVAAGDGPRVRERALAMLSPLRAGHEVSHLYVIAADGRCLARGHAPDLFGDHLRHVVVDLARRTGRVAAGPEVGLLGTVALRLAVPVPEDPPWLLELGVDLPSLLRHVQVRSSSTALLLRPHALARALPATTLPDAPGSLTLPDGSRLIGPPATVAALSALQRTWDVPHATHADETLPLDLDGAAARAAFVSLTDPLGSDLGDVVVVLDMTDVTVATDRVLAALLVCLGLLLLLALTAWHRWAAGLRDAVATYHATLRSRLASRLAAERAVADVSTLLVQRGLGAMDEVLGLLGRSVRADRAYLFELIDDDRIMRNSHEYCAPGVPAQQSMLQDVPTAEFPWWMTCLRRGEPISIGSLDDMPHEAAAERAILASQGIRATLVVPLVSGGRLTGFLGFDDVHAPRNWAPETVRLLRTVAEVVVVHQSTARAQEEGSRLVTALNQTAEAVVITDAGGRVEYVNPAFTRMTLYDACQVRGRTLSLLTSGRQSPAFYRTLWETVTAGEVWQGTLTNRRRDGTFYDEDMTISPVRGPSGTIDHFVAVKRDVTAERQAADRLLQAERRQALTTLAAGIAHDFNNVLAVIVGFAEAARDELPPSNPVHGDLGEIITACARGGDLVRRLTSLGRPAGSTERRLLDPRPLTVDLLKLIRGMVPPTVTLRDDVAPTLPALVADPTDLQQILVNLAANAAHAMRETGGTLAVALAGLDGSTIDDPGLPFCFIGPILRLTVTDTGCGMDDGTLARLYEPYFTTRLPGEGTGLGLATVRAIVDELGGAITVDSSPGLGTSFRVYLPAASGETCASPIPRPETPSGPSAPGLRVAIVDDSPELCRVFARGLRDFGCEVTVFTDPDEALAAIPRDPVGYDTIVLDYVMPGTSGLTLARHLRERLPRVPLILCTGTVDPAVEGEARALGISATVHKPLSPASLALTVRRTVAAYGDR